eukprot:7996016-Prorocentrum_lima.AAC.1
MFRVVRDRVANELNELDGGCSCDQLKHMIDTCIGAPEAFDAFCTQYDRWQELHRTRQASAVAAFSNC